MPNKQSFIMRSLSLVAVVTCALILFLQHAEARNIISSLDNSIESQERTLRLPDSFYFKGLVNVLGLSYNFGIWINEPLKKMKVEMAMPGIVEKRMFVHGDEGSYGTLNEYTKIFEDELCHFVKGTPSKPFVVKSKLSDEELDFVDSEVVKGVELEKWVKETEQLSISLYIRRTRKEPVPVRMVISLKSARNFVVNFDIKEYSSKPVPADEFEYDSSGSRCTEVRVPENSSALGLFSADNKAPLVKREVHEAEYTLQSMSEIFRQHFV